MHQAVALNPSDYSAHNNLGIVYEEKGRLKSAEKEYRLALKLNPEFKEARVNLHRLRDKNILS